ncbi:MAG TPA: GNAT family protein [Acidimicrobiales bacterium]|nr:GNAT family protein [Acidimicrobiales bacterium]
MGSSFWPLFELELVTDRLVMRPPRDDDFPGLLEAVDAGIHDPEDMPFSVPWTDVEPPARRLLSVQHWWGHRSGWSVDDWHLAFAVFVDDRPVGVQSLLATRFPVLKEVSTGSWLTRSAQGHGIGREMRAAVLQFAFDELGAEIARSGAYVDNPASQKVSRAIGYRENGRRREAPRGVPKEMVDFELSREEWSKVSGRFKRARIKGVGACRDMFVPKSEGGERT